MNRKDQQILAEAYQASHLKQHLPNLTIEQLHVVIENASPTELDVIEELFGGLRNIAKSAKEGIQAAGQAVGQAARDAGDIAKSGVDAAKAGAGQIKDNAKGMYKAGEDEAAAEKRKSQLINHVAQLEELLAAHIASSPRSGLPKNISNITISQLNRALSATAAAKTKAASAARSGGFLGGAGAAMQKEYEKKRAGQKTANPNTAGGAAPAPA